VELYAAIPATDVAFKSTNYISEDLEGRIAPAILDELRTGFSKRICYSAAEPTRKALIDAMNEAMDAKFVKDDHHMVKITVSVKVEMVRPDEPKK